MAKILLVDDNATLLKHQGEFLCLAGHEVTTAPDGKQAMRLVQTQAFELVITDLVMPEKEGIEIIRELRQSHPALKIIAMSGGGRGDAKDYLAIAKALGASQVLAKPFSGEELLQAVNSTLPVPS